MTPQDEDFIRQLVKNERRAFWKGVICDLLALGAGVMIFSALWVILP